LGGKPLIRTPDPTTEPTSGTRPQEETRETLPPPPENPYGPIDFDLVDEETNEITLTSGNAIKGIDVSEWQGDIDWQQVKDSGVEYVIIRVGGRGTEEGTLYGDDRCQEYYAGATAVGLKVGAYIFAQSITVEEAVEEAEFVLEQVKDWDVQMPLVYDWEYVDSESRTGKMDSRTLTDMAKAFCDTIKEAGYTPMIYFGRSQSMDLMHLEELVEYPFWLAMYSTIMDYPYKIDMWQYTETGSVPGISGNVDINLYFPWEED
jgi:GH25 family lysozyme M1 (1,4-beta-N-acetylmuramidase)